MIRLNGNHVPNRRTYPVKVLQFGEGNFMRAFFNWMMDRMNREANFSASAVVVQPIERGMSQQLNEQDGLFTLYLQGLQNGRPAQDRQVIESISRAVDPYTDVEAYLALAEIPELRYIVSNTTEAGIAFREDDRLDDAPQKCFPGKLTALLYRRYRTFRGAEDKGFVIIPCELIDRNGDKLKDIVLRYARLWALEDAFIEWVVRWNTFCCSLVDRIVPGYPKDDIERITEELGYEDQLVVVGEWFHLWVIEGPGWIADELPFAEAGLNVKIVEDMTPYRTRKVRILNGAHSAMAPTAFLYGVDTVREAIEHDVLGEFARSLIEDEIIPTLDLPLAELRDFAEAVVERFRNPYINHYLSSILLNSMSKFETRDLPSLLEYVRRNGKLPRRLVFALAALLGAYEGRRGDEAFVMHDDPDITDMYHRAWTACDGTKPALYELVKTVLGYESVWKQDLNDIAGLTDAVTESLFRIKTEGMRAALQAVR
ncbi:tagaturonate reductase [Paenibacillus sp. TRM 82003]|nr:tagaturonate reductase [Paenibacillus sp. TRM 82003]